ncbi:MAG: hypothetical protein E7388_05455 [Ruminococcaceae bacterium]|nr:hypothetical protein [Oscillospiraceae bacterium]
MKKAGTVLTLIGLILFVIGYIGGVIYTVFGFVSAFGEYPEDFYTADKYIIKAIVNAALILLIGGVVIAFTVIALNKSRKGKPSGIIELIIVIISSMQIHDVVSNLATTISIRTIAYADSLYPDLGFEILRSYVYTGAFAKALGCIFIVIGVCCMIINKQRKIKEE